MRHRHTTPFEMVEFKFRVRVPMDCWRQWIRHRTASVNEYSTRYSVAISDKQQTTEWRAQSVSNKQGSAGGLLASMSEGGQLWLATEEARAEAAGDTPRTLGEFLTEQEHDLHEHADAVYNERIHLGVAREQARKDLPLSTYTEAYWKINLHNLLHFLGLRMDSHAQQEIRSYAWVIGEEIVAKVVPVTWQAFLDYSFESMTLTKLDCEQIKALVNACFTLPATIDDFNSMQHPAWAALARCRERDECLEKLQKLGLVGDV